MSNAVHWWRLSRQAIEAESWLVAEGALLRMIEQHGPHPDLLDLLGYALLMQGGYSRCETVLRQALELGSRNFWTPHKLGDALRGQQRREEAAAAYEQALEWGSDSNLTVRNLLEVLYQLSREQALERLEGFIAPVNGRGLAWEPLQPWQEGAIEAAITTAGPELAQWLCDRGCPAPAVRRVAWQEALAQLQIAAVLELLDGQRDAQAEALQRRLQGLLVGDVPLSRRRS